MPGEAAAVLERPPTPKPPVEASVPTSPPQPPSEAPDTAQQAAAGAGESKPDQPEAAGEVTEGQEPTDKALVQLDNKDAGAGTSNAEAKPEQSLQDRVADVAARVLDAQVRVAREAVNRAGDNDPISRGKLALVGYGALAQLQGESTSDFIGDEPLPVTIEGNDLQVLKVLSGNETHFQCQVAGESKPRDVKREDLLRAYFLAEAPAIANELPPDHPQRKALELHRDALRGQNDLKNWVELNRVITAAEANLAGEKWMSPIDTAVAQRIGELQTQIPTLRAKSFDVSGLSQSLKVLQAAQAHANGELGFVFKAGALRASGVTQEDIERAVPAFAQQFAQARETIMQNMQLTEEQMIALERAADDPALAATVLQQGLLKHADGVEELVFGRRLEPGELEKILQLPPNKRGLGLVMMIALVVGKQFFQPLVENR